MPYLTSTNPAKNYKPVGKIKISTATDIKQAVEKAHKAGDVWKEIGVKERVNLLSPLARLIKKNKTKLAELTTKETGKSITEARSEVDETINHLRHSLKTATRALADEPFTGDAGKENFIRREPWGVVATITPWNFPLLMPEWGVVPALLAGNTVVLKPSEESPLIAASYAKLVRKLGLPSGVFNIVQGGKEAGERLIDSDIDFIWFTGSTRAGQAIYKKAGEKFISSLMELGGSSPTIIFEDVKVNKGLIDNITKGRFASCGQACSSIKRLLVHYNIYNELIEKLVEKIRNLKVGDPMKPGTDIGSLVAKRQVKLLRSQVQDAKRKGATIECGGKAPKDLAGAYFLPTIITNVKPTMRVVTEEVFGPVLPIIPFSREEEAIRIANNTEYGLTSEIYTNDKRRALRVASKIEAGRVAINTPRSCGPTCPFGGYKKSGMGREHGKWGFLELTQMKHILIENNH